MRALVATLALVPLLAGPLRGLAAVVAAARRRIRPSRSDLAG